MSLPRTGTVAATTVVCLGFEYRSYTMVNAEDHSATYCQVRGRLLGHCSTVERKGSDDASDGTAEFESAR